MPIRRHGKGWEVRVQQAGQRISRSFRSRGDAAEFERRARQRLEDSRVGRPAQHSLEEAVDRWLGNEAKALRSFDNLQDKVKAIYKHIKGRPLEAAPEAAEAIIKAGLEAGLKPATVNRRAAIVRRVARLAYRKWQWLQHDVSGRISLVPGELARDVQATPQQAKALIEAAEGKVQQAIIWGALTGLRRGEIVQVEPHHFRGRRLILASKTTKTGKPRSVPLAPDLRPADFPYGITLSELDKGFQKARSDAQMPWLQFRDLRRTCGSWVVQRTGNLKAAQDLLGHSTIAITAKHYSHLLDEHVAEAVHTLPRLAGMARGRAKRRKVA